MQQRTAEGTHPRNAPITAAEQQPRTTEQNAF